MITTQRLFKYFAWTIAAFVVLLCLIFSYYSLRSVLREESTVNEISPPTGHFVQADDASIFYQELGPANGSPVILIHGTGSWSEIWRETMIALADNGYRAIAIDIPPFGFSEKLFGREQFTTEKQGKRLNAALEALNIRNGLLVGHSVGGRPTLEAILNNQDRINRLVLVDVALGFAPDSIQPHFTQNDPGFMLKSLFELKPLRNSIFRTFGTNPQFTKFQLESFVFNKAAILPEHVAMLQRPLSLNGFTIANADWFEYLTVSSDHQGLSTEFRNFNRIKLPTLIIWGDKDDITPLWQGKYLAKVFPDAELNIMKDVGHIPYLENSKRFNDILLDFINKTN